MRPVLVFVELARRMNDERSRLHGNRLIGRSHHPAAFEAEVDLGRMRVTVIGADLPWLPASHSDVAVVHAAQDFFNVPFYVENLLINYVECEHLAPFH